MEFYFLGTKVVETSWVADSLPTCNPSGVACGSDPKQINNIGRGSAVLSIA
jgi:hypothetical protein